LFAKQKLLHVGAEYFWENV